MDAKGHLLLFGLEFVARLAFVVVAFPASK